MKIVKRKSSCHSCKCLQSLGAGRPYCILKYPLELRGDYFIPFPRIPCPRPTTNKDCLTAMAEFETWRWNEIHSRRE